jgi:hypothetical protein
MTDPGPQRHGVGAIRLNFSASIPRLLSPATDVQERLYKVQIAGLLPGV